MLIKDFDILALWDQGRHTYHHHHHQLSSSSSIIIIHHNHHHHYGLLLTYFWKAPDTILKPTLSSFTPHEDALKLDVDFALENLLYFNMISTRLRIFKTGRMDIKIQIDGPFL